MKSTSLVFPTQLNHGGFVRDKQKEYKNSVTGRGRVSRPHINKDIKPEHLICIKWPPDSVMWQDAVSN